MVSNGLALQGVCVAVKIVAIVQYAGQIFRRVWHVLVIISHIVAVPTAAIEIWVYVRPSPNATTIPSWPSLSGKSGIDT
jgi:hypothetical protein